jgi:hypothetical protein
VNQPITAPPGVISCCLCLNIKGKRVPATTIVKGYAVCDDHVMVVAEPHFDLFRLSRRARAV